MAVTPPPPDIAAKLEILRQQAAEKAKQDDQYSRQTDRQYTPVIQPNPNWMPKKADGGNIDAMRYALMNKGGRPLTAKQFYNQYAQHIDLRGRQEGKSAENAKAILEHGFRSGMGTNALPPYAGGKPKDVIASKFKPQHGDMVYLAPKGAWKDTPNGMKIVHGWKPEPHEVINVTDPDQSMYDAYMAGLNKKSKGGLEKFLEPSKVKERVYHGTPNTFKSFQESPTYVALDPKFASDYGLSKTEGFEYAPEDTAQGASVMPLHVQIKNPFDYEERKHVIKLLRELRKKGHKNWDKKDIGSGSFEMLEDPKIYEAMKRLGHDAFYVNEGYGDQRKNLGIFNPKVIKSAIGNRGTYDINDPDITKARGGRVTHAHHLEIEERPL